MNDVQEMQQRFADITTYLNNTIPILKENDVPEKVIQAMDMYLHIANFAQYEITKEGLLGPTGFVLVASDQIIKYIDELQ